MRTNLHYGSFCLLIFSFISLILTAQSFIDTDSFTVVKMRGGKEVIGIIHFKNDEKILLKTLRNDTITIYWENVKRTFNAGRECFVKGKFWYENPYASHYFMGPSAFGLSKGEGYYHNGLGIFNQAQYGITNRFSLRGWFVPGFILDAGTPIVINPQLSFPTRNDKINWGLGGIYLVNMYDAFNFEESTGILYGITTLGSKERNITLGFGYGYNFYYKENLPVAIFNTTYRISRKMYLVAENFFFKVEDDNYYTTMNFLGGRFAPRGIAIDFGVIAFFDDIFNYPDFSIAPWLGLTIPFGRG